MKLDIGEIYTEMKMHITIVNKLNIYIQYSSCVGLTAFEIAEQAECIAYISQYLDITITMAPLSQLYLGISMFINYWCLHQHR